MFKKGRTSPGRKIIIPPTSPILRAAGWSVYLRPLTVGHASYPLWAELQLVHTDMLGQKFKRGVHRTRRLSWGVELQRFSWSYDYHAIRIAYPQLLEPLGGYCRDRFTLDALRRIVGEVTVNAALSKAAAQREQRTIRAAVDSLV